MPSICPRLGRKSEPALATEFPSSRNYCFHCQTPTLPKMTHQENFCLTEAYQDCTVFLQPGQEPFPQNLRGASFDSLRRSLRAFINLGLLINNLFKK